MGFAAEKEKYWNDMVNKLFEQFNERMEQNIYEYLNMYVKNDYTIKEELLKNIDNK